MIDYYIQDTTNSELQKWLHNIPNIGEFVCLDDGTVRKVISIIHGKYKSILQVLPENKPEPYDSYFNYIGV